MTTAAPDLDAEREVDLGRWRRAVVRLWWLPVLGLIIGAVAGLYPALRAARLSPTDALRTV